MKTPLDIMQAVSLDWSYASWQQSSMSSSK